MYKIEKEWISNTGYTCRVTGTDMGHRCGYVGVKFGSVYYGKKYDEILDVLNGNMYMFEVHGGVTFSDFWGKQGQEFWWIGYNCGHSGDGKDLSLITDPKMREIYENSYFSHEFPFRTTEYCIKECERLAEQMQKFDPIYLRKLKLEKLLA